jgi:transcriptional regulator with XRE-family HTH domain
LSRNLSQRQLGERLGTTQGRVSMIETGANVSRETAERYARALLCDISDLVTPDEPTVTLRLSEIPPELLGALTKH